MWFQETKTGKYRYFERYLDPETRKKKIISLTLDGNRRSDQKAAQKALDQRIEVLQMPKTDNPGRTFGELCDAYMEHQEEACKKQTHKSDLYRFVRIREAIGKDTPVLSITAPMIREAFEDEAPSTYNDRLKHIKAMFRWAYREEYVSDISFLDRLPRKKVPSVREKDYLKYLEKDELAQLLNGMKVEDWKLLTHFLALSGLRIGEAVALTVEDVDLQERLIRVNKTYSPIIREVSTTKTEASFRSVFIQDELMEVCRAILERKEKNKERFGEKSDLFFPTLDGDHIIYECYSKYFRENTEAILGRRLSVHALRHTHVALLAENGIPLDVISRRLGHADSAITRDVYFHVTKRLAEKDAEMINGVKLL